MAPAAATGICGCGSSAQGITAGEFAELLRAINAGVAYVNVHSSKFPAVKRAGS